MLRSALCGALGALVLAGCREQGHKGAGVDSTELAGRETRLEQLKQRTDSASSDAPIARWVLPQSLNEISGLALTQDGRRRRHTDPGREVADGC